MSLSKYKPHFNDHVRLVYDSVPKQNGWESLIRQLADALEFRSGIFSIEGLDGSGIVKRYTTGYTEQENIALNEYFHKKDIWTDALRQKPYGEVHSSDSLVSSKTFAKSEFYNDFCKPVDMAHTTGVFINTQNHLGLKIGFQHRHDQGLIGDKAVYLQSLVPHLSKAVDLKQKLISYRSNLATITEMIDTFPVAAMVVDEKAVIKFANAYADKLFAKNILAINSRNQLKFKNFKLQEILERLIQNAIKILNGEATLLNIDNIHLGDPESDARLEIQVQPMTASDSKFGLEYQKPLALVYIKEGTPQTALNREFLQSLFRLSSREMELASLLVQGKKLNEIALLKHRSLNTLKTQLKSLFQKTGTNSQSQLVARLLGSLAAAKV